MSQLMGISKLIQEKEIMIMVFMKLPRGKESKCDFFDLIFEYNWTV